MKKYKFRVVTIPSYGHYIQIKTLFKWSFLRETLTCEPICVCGGLSHEQNKFFHNEAVVRNFIENNFDASNEHPRVFWNGLKNTWVRQLLYYIEGLKAEISGR